MATQPAPVKDDEATRLTLDEELHRLAVGRTQVDRAVDAYHRKLEGLAPWEVFVTPATPEAEA
jgi:hypothetical protein